MASTTGECEIYCIISDIGSISGDVNHFMKVSLYKQPQKTNTGRFFGADVIIKNSEGGYCSLNVKIGTYILVEVPTVGFKQTFVVPALDSYNIANTVT